MVKLEIRTGGQALPPEKLDRTAPYRATDAAVRVLWLVQSWCGKWPGSILQLSAEQLNTLRQAANGDTLFHRHGESEPLPASAEELRLLDRFAERETKGSPEPEPTARKAPAPPSDPKEKNPPEGIPGTIDGSEHFLAIQLPSKDHPAYAVVRERVQADRFKLEPSNRKWWLRDRERVLEFLADYGSVLESEWGLQATQNFRKRTAGIRFLSPSIRVEKAGPSGKDFAVRVDWEGVGDEEVRSAADRGARKIERDGTLFLIGTEQLKRVSVLRDRLRSCGTAVEEGRIRLRPEAVTTVDDWLAEWPERTVSPSEWKENVRRLRDPDAVELPDLPGDLEGRLRGYQRLGAGWFWNLHQGGLGGILADEMGLGKTIQSLALAASLGRQDFPSLVVCPASLVENWTREAREFAPSLNAHAYHGGSRSLEFAELSGRDLVITSYGTLRADRALFLKTEFATIIADEAQHFKNPSSETARVMHRLQGQSRFALTGTPIENSLSDLVGIGRFALSAVFPQSDPSPDAASVETVLAKTRPYLLRRTKSEVLRDLPEKWESRRYVALSSDQRRTYDEIRVRTEQRLFRIRSSSGTAKKVTAELWTELLRLRQVTAEPRILDPELPRTSSSKAEGLIELVEEVTGSGGRMLVFSQFTQTLKWLRLDLEEEKVPYCYLDGGTRNRQALVDRFNRDAGIPVFLLSLKAGGTGLNLTGADTVVHYDPWWNPAAEAQATDRAHRIGQTRRVQSIKLIGTGTVEEKVLQLQEEKRALLGNLFEGKSETVMDWDALESLLSKD